MNRKLLTTIYVDKLCSTYQEVSAILEMIGLPQTNNQSQASVIISSPSNTSKTAMFEGNRDRVYKNHAFFNAKNLSNIFNYQRIRQLVVYKDYQFPAWLDQLKKNEIIATFSQSLFQLVLNQKKDLTFFWPYPNGAQGVINYRLDIDDNVDDSMKILLKQLTSNYKWCSFFFTTSNFVKSKHFIKQVKKKGAEIGTHHHYHFTYEKDHLSNKKNLELSLHFLKNLSLTITGYTTPSAKVYSTIGQYMSQNNLKYTSNFGYLFDMLPLFINRETSNYLEVPVHPICPGNFIKNRIQDESTILNYFKNTARKLAQSNLPLFFYGHNNDNYKLKFLPKFLKFLSSTFPNYCFTTLSDYANFWHTRASQIRNFNPNRNYLNTATIFFKKRNQVFVKVNNKKRASYSFDLSKYLKGPIITKPINQKISYVQRIIDDNELETIVPLSALNLTSTSGLKKAFYKTLIKIRHPH